jgi:putative chitobiose transport system permease protein
LLVIAVFLLYPIGAVVYYSFTDYNIVRPPVWAGLKELPVAGERSDLPAGVEAFIYLPARNAYFDRPFHRARNRRQPQAARHPGLPDAVFHTGHQRDDRRRHRLADDVRHQRDHQRHPGDPGVIKEPIQWLAEPSFTLPIAMMLTTWLGLGYYMMILLAGLQNIPEELYDAAAIDGCNGWQKHWHVSIPGLRPQITFVAVISSLAALQVFNEIFILYGSLGGILNSGYTVVFYLWQQAFRLNHAGRASAIALVLLVITLVFSVS